MNILYTYIIGFISVPVIFVILNVLFNKTNRGKITIGILLILSFLWPFGIVLLFYGILLEINNRCIKNRLKNNENKQ